MSNLALIFGSRQSIFYLTDFKTICSVINANSIRLQARFLIGDYFSEDPVTGYETEEEDEREES